MFMCVCARLRVRGRVPAWAGVRVRVLARMGACAGARGGAGVPLVYAFSQNNFYTELPEVGYYWVIKIYFTNSSDFMELWYMFWCLSTKTN